MKTHSIILGTKFPLIKSSKKSALPVDLSEEVAFTIHLKVNKKGKLAKLKNDLLSGKHYTKGFTYTAEETANIFSADPTKVQAVCEYFQSEGFKILSSSAEKRMVELTGTLAQIEKTLHTRFKYIDFQDKNHRVHVLGLKLPAAISGCVESITGLSTLPLERVGSMHSRTFKPESEAQREAADRALAERGAAPTIIDDYGSYSPLVIAGMYNFPKNCTGKGQTIAIIELGGGYSDEEMTTYFQDMGVPKPDIVSIGTNNEGGGSFSTNGEVALDIQVAGAIAYDAKYRVYFEAATIDGFTSALKQAIADKVNIISISWGMSEKYWSSAEFTTFENLMLQAAMTNITVTVATGDRGSTNGDKDKQNHVQYPAASAYALACGGTAITVNENAQITDEVVWNSFWGSTGGGFSDLITQIPSYQQAVFTLTKTNKTTRGIPDVGGMADKSKVGYPIMSMDMKQVTGGTSAVSPLWAALCALFNEALGKSVGFINPILYQHNNTAAFRQILQGNNGAYSAAPIWNPCTGLGVPDGNALLAILQAKSTT